MADTRYDDTAPPRRGVSLAKGPVAIIGIASLALGILGFVFADRSFTFDFPSGTVEGDTFFGIEGNGWTWLMFAAAGLLLLLGSPIHWGAKSMAFIVGVALGVGALIALSDGNDVLGHHRHQQLDEADHGRRRRRAGAALDDAARRPSSWRRSRRHPARPRRSRPSGASTATARRHRPTALPTPRAGALEDRR